MGLSGGDEGTSIGAGREVGMARMAWKTFPSGFDKPVPAPRWRGAGPCGIWSLLQP